MTTNLSIITEMDAVEDMLVDLDLFLAITRENEKEVDVMIRHTRATSSAIGRELLFHKIDRK